MKCPNCAHTETKVVDSRPVSDSAAIRRRRECEACEFRFSTYEQIEILDLAIIKRNKETQSYSRAKLQRGIERAFVKRPLSEDLLSQILNSIETKIQQSAQNGQISSEKIGDIALSVLKKIDKVAYVRFASVYKAFGEIEDFNKILTKL